MRAQVVLLAIMSMLVVGCIEEDKCIGMAKTDVANRLKDPMSAQFRNVKLTKDGNVCGEVNGKNSYGAYSGFVSFYYVCNKLSPKDSYLVMDSGKLTDFANQHGVGSIMSCD